MSDEQRATEDDEPTGETHPASVTSHEPLAHARRWRRIAGRLALGGSLVWIVLALGLDRYGQARPAPEGRWDAIVVLGCRVYPDGRPSVALSRRVRAAAELYAAGRAETIVLTGGVGDSGFTEAEVAAELAESLGVPRTALVLEGRSTSTEENAEFAAALIEGRRVVVVTDAYHVVRSERVFGRYFDEVSMVGTVSPRWWPRSRGALREVVAIAGYAVRGRL